MAKANDEQLLAINHFGGKLLQAGAGSGKTFVLKEHIAHIIEDILFDNSGNLKTSQEEEIRQNLKEGLNKIVLMTFTKKAAGELAIRVMKKIDEKIEEEATASDGLELNGIKPWVLVREMIDYLTISTIDGFCYKLLKQGFLVDFPVNIEIVDDTQAANKVASLFDEWLVLEGDKHNPEIVEMLYSHNDNMRKSLTKIFGDCDLRILWNDLTPEQLEEFNLGEVVQKIFKLENLEHVFNDQPSAGEYTEYAKQKWHGWLEKWNRDIHKVPENYEEWKDFHQYLQDNGKVTKPRVNLGLAECDHFFEAFKKVKKFVNDNNESIQMYYENKDTVLLPWFEVFKEIFNYIENRYMDKPGLTFSDLEYYILLAVRDKEISKKILEEYNYFIIDEFQDTSFVQFEIIEQIIQHDYSKIFCVGDVKQAIYGFKGGEIKVFQNCKDSVTEKNVMDLSNNYRSEGNIINFNNQLFDLVFNLGIGFKDNDFDPVEVIYQKVPKGHKAEDGGILSKTECHWYAQGDKKVKSSVDDLNKLEAELIFDKIVELRKKEESTIAILYRKLGPSFYLIESLLANKLGFTSQIKIPYEEEPILGIFRTLFENLFDRNVTKRDEGFKFVHLMLKTYFNLLWLSTDGIEDNIKSFYNDLTKIGPYSSFIRFCYNSGISNSNQDNNFKRIKLICDQSAHIEDIPVLFDQSSDDKFSIEFQTGENPGKIIIMTAHGSKGLEFPHVILGGIQANGGSMPNTDFIGKLPGSFKWYLNSKDKTSYKTPTFLYEGIFEKHKEFSESKRLFYVACSRAEVGLHWIDIKIDNIGCSPNKNSWIFGIREFEALNADNSLIKHLNENTKRISRELIPDMDEVDEPVTPLFHSNPIGTSVVHEDTLLSLQAEISVTKIAALVDCPRKFYLRNVCKIEDDDLDILSEYLTERSEDEFDEKESEVVENFKGDFDLDQHSLKNTATRGTFIHNTIEEAIKHNFVIPHGDYEIKDKQALEYAVEYVKTYKDAQLIAEEGIKFSFFGHMISGTPDLVILDKNNPQIVDYKTGRLYEGKLPPYWLQLKIYAFALFELGKVSLDKEIELILLFVDEKDKVSMNVKYESLKTELLEVWKLSTKPDRTNQDHCPRCPYRPICNFSH